MSWELAGYDNDEHHRSLSEGGRTRSKAWTEAARHTDRGTGRALPERLVPVLKAHKPALRALLKLPFVMLESQILGETLFFCEDEDTRAALVEAGAAPWSIYTKDELRTLCEQNRVAPLSIAELRKVHEIKRTFDGRVTK